MNIWRYTFEIITLTYNMYRVLSMFINIVNVTAVMKLFVVKRNSYLLYPPPCSCTHRPQFVYHDSHNVLQYMPYRVQLQILQLQLRRYCSTFIMVLNFHCLLRTLFRNRLGDAVYDISMFDLGIVQYIQIRKKFLVD